MIRPMPFCPSLEPWKNDTSVQVSVSRPRIHSGGGEFAGRRRIKLGLRMSAFITSSSSADKTKPNSGDSSSASPILVTWSQSTPDVPSWPRIIALATPTPTIEPISVCELEAGRPSHQVPRFQMIAAISSANTIAKPALEPTCRMSSTGSSETMPKATAPRRRRARRAG